MGMWEGHESKNMNKLKEIDGTLSKLCLHGCEIEGTYLLWLWAPC